jgi:[ribosomal protein S5]-alanine N-acetyltransferase
MDTVDLPNITVNPFRNFLVYNTMKINIPTLYTDRLILRKLTVNDASDMFEYAKDPELAGMGLWLPFNDIDECIKDLTQNVADYEAGKLISWAMELRDDGKMLGRCGLVDQSFFHQRAEVSYAMNRTYWDKGLMSEAMNEVVRYSFEVLLLNRLGAGVLPENIASIRILEKLGFIYEGTRRELTNVRGKFDDVSSYSLLRKEWLRTNET